MYDNVLVPTDGSETALLALEDAGSLVRRYDATLHTIHVVETTGVTDTLDDDQFEDVVDRIERAGTEAVETVVDRAQAQGIDDVESAVRHGLPHEEIPEYVEEQGIDIVVMATAGRTGAERDVIGSCTERLVRSSPVPVLTIRE